MKRTKDILLDFTPLLDVTMIILFFFLLFSKLNTDAVLQDAETQKQAAYSAAQDAEAAKSDAESAKLRAEQARQAYEAELAQMKDADANQGAVAEALDAFGRGENLKLRLEMNEVRWQLLVTGPNDFSEIIFSEDMSGEALEGAFRDAGYSPDDALLCTFIYNGNAPVSREAHSAVMNAVSEVKQHFTLFYLSETDISNERD